MLFRRLYDDDLAQASYLIGCQQTGEALVIDPSREVVAYMRAAEEDRLRITHVSETHIHADFLSGSRELARRTNAQLLLSAAGGPDWRYGYAAGAGATELRDGDSFEVGRIRIDVTHTPGHTPEHLAFLVTDGAVASEPMGIVTGDSLFVGDVGRPDLLVKTGAIGLDVRADRDAVMREMASSARVLFRTLQRLRELPEHLQVWPGHGAGSPCGKSLGAVPQTTIGYELRFNWAFSVRDEDEFVERILDGQPEPPRYFARMKRLNRDGPPAPALVSAPVALHGEALPTLRRSGTIVVDTRPVRQFSAGHIPGSINIPLDRSFLIRAGSVLPDDAIVALLVDGGLPLAQRPIRGLSLIGIDEVRGVFDSSALDWQQANGGLASTPLRAPADVARDDGAQIIDVRGAAEYAAGHIPGALNVPLPELADRVAALPAGPLVLHCQGGTRSAIAASVVRAGGRDDVSDMDGGFAAWEQAGLPVASNAGRPDGAGGAQP